MLRHAVKILALDCRLNHLLLGDVRDFNNPCQLPTQITDDVSVKIRVRPALMTPVAADEDSFGHGDLQSASTILPVPVVCTSPQ